MLDVEFLLHREVQKKIHQAKVTGPGSSPRSSPPERSKVPVLPENSGSSGYLLLLLSAMNFRLSPPTSPKAWVPRPKALLNNSY